MQAFHSLFHAKPTLGTLSAELNAQIITVRPDGKGVWQCRGPVTFLQSEVEWADGTGPVEEAIIDKQTGSRLLGDRPPKPHQCSQEMGALTLHLVNLINYFSVVS